MPPLKPETLKAIQGNAHTADNIWLGEQIEKGTNLQFCFNDGTEAVVGVLVVMGTYNYLAAIGGEEVLINKASIKTITASKA